MNKLKKTIVCLDMAGCPNRCKHCWLGAAPNGRMEREDLEFIAKAFRPYTSKLEVSSWYREPDFRDDYKELWELECRLSDERTPHFDLMSFWRMVRDPGYADWLYSLGMRKCQLTLFGSEKTTDYYVGRKGAYREILQSMDILLEHKIAPRIQIFINKENIDELPFLEQLIHKMELEKRCQDIGQEFMAFVHQGSCEGENEKLYDIRITEEDSSKIPKTFEQFTLKHFGINNLNEILGISEKNLFAELLEERTKYQIVSDSPVFYVDASFDVYPNASQLSPWWCLGNLKSDGAEKVIADYINHKSKAQNFIETIPTSEMVRLCGNPDSKRLFTKGDYITYIQNQYCRSME